MIICDGKGEELNDEKSLVMCNVVFWQYDLYQEEILIRTQKMTIVAHQPSRDEDGGVARRRRQCTTKKDEARAA
jgi:hypothetical protein